MQVDRRTFIIGAGAAGALVLLPKKEAEAKIRED